jgi:hypothetical protein
MCASIFLQNMSEFEAGSGGGGGEEDEGNDSDVYDNEGDEEYDYVYEEDDDDLDGVSAPQLGREVSESHFDVPSGDCNIHKYIEIAPLMEKLILEVSMLLGVDRSIAELLLRHTKWDQSLLAEKYYNNSHQLLIAAGVELENVEETKTSVCAASPLTQCLICYDEIEPGTGKSLRCGHLFCQ